MSTGIFTTLLYIRVEIESPSGAWSPASQPARMALSSQGRLLWVGPGKTCEWEHRITTTKAKPADYNKLVKMCNCVLCRKRLKAYPI